MIRIVSKVVNINPDKPQFIAGHAMRKEKSKGIHDDIQAVVMWLEIDDNKFLFADADISGFDYNFVHWFKYTAVERFGIPYDNIILSVGHSHSAPLIETRDANMPHDPEWRNLVFNNILNTADEIKNDTVEVNRVVYHTGVSSGYYGNRNNINEYGDNNIYMFEFKDSNDKNIAAIINISCHSTVLSPLEYQLSGDLLAAIRREMTDFLGVAPLVCNGNAGDMSNRLYRKANDFDELKRVSSGIAKQIMNFTTTCELELANPKTKSFVFEVKYKRDIDALQESYKAAKDKLESTTAFDDRKWLISEIAGFERKMKNKDVDIKFENTIMRFNDLEIVVLPCELVSSFGKQIKDSSTAKVCIVWGYANGKTGYVVEAKSFGDGHSGISTELPKGKAEEYVGLVIQNLFN